MAGSSEEANENASEMEKLNLQEERSPDNEKLAQSLRQMITKSVKETRAACRAEKKKASGNVPSNKVFASIQRPEDDDDWPLTNEMKQLGRKIKNQVVAERVVCFSLPAEICDHGNIKDIDKVKERLGKWRIQRRQRDSKMSDMYYCHLSTRQTFRSITEAVSFIMCESDLKPTQKKHKDENITFESPLKKAKMNEKSEDHSLEPFENRMNTNLAKSDLEEIFMSDLHEESSPVEALEYQKAFEELLLLCEPNSNVPNPSSDANKSENGKDIQAQITTEGVEAHTMTSEANEENPQFKEYSVEVGTVLEEKGRTIDPLQENFRQQFLTQITTDAVEALTMNDEVNGENPNFKRYSVEVRTILEEMGRTSDLPQENFGQHFQTQIATDAVEALTMTYEANEENPKFKEYSVEVGTVLEENGRKNDLLQENFGQHFQTQIVTDAVEALIMGNEVIEENPKFKEYSVEEGTVLEENGRTSDFLQENIGQHCQTQIATDAVEALTMTNEAHEENPKFKEYSVEVGTVLEEKGRTSDLLHENFGQEFQTLEEALANIGNIILEGVDDVEKDNAQYDTNQLQDITMDWASNDSILDSFFDECDLVNHIPTCKDVPDLAEFLINNRKK